MSADLSFTAALVQMRTGLLPEPSLEQGTKLIRQAAAEAIRTGHERIDRSMLPRANAASPERIEAVTHALDL